MHLCWRPHTVVVPGIPNSGVTVTILGICSNSQPQACKAGSLDIPGPLIHFLIKLTPLNPPLHPTFCCSSLELTVFPLILSLQPGTSFPHSVPLTTPAHPWNADEALLCQGSLLPIQVQFLNMPHYCKVPYLRAHINLRDCFNVILHCKLWGCRNCLHSPMTPGLRTESGVAEYAE